MRVAKDENMVYVVRRRGTSEAAPLNRTPSLVASRSRRCRARTSASASVPVRRFVTGSLSWPCRRCGTMERASSCEPCVIVSSWRCHRFAPLGPVVFSRCGMWIPCRGGPPALEAFSSHLSSRIDDCPAMYVKATDARKRRRRREETRRPCCKTAIFAQVGRFSPKGSLPQLSSGSVLVSTKPWETSGKIWSSSSFFVSADDVHHSQAMQVERNELGFGVTWFKTIWKRFGHVTGSDKNRVSKHKTITSPAPSQ